MTPRFALSLIAALYSVAAFAQPNYDALFEERKKSLVAIEYFVETDVDRRPTTVFGIVMDDEGLVQLLDSSVPNWSPVDRLKEFKAYRPGDPKDYMAVYLGADRARGWHFVRVEPALAKQLVSVTTYGVASLKPGSSVWGIGLANKDMDFTAYFMRADVALVHNLPDPVGFATLDVVTPGSLVFDDAGAFAGWGANSINMEHVLQIEGKVFKALLRKPDVSNTFYEANSFLSQRGAPPANPEDSDANWLGVVGLNALDDEVAEHMGLEGRSAISLSEIIPGGPADKAGLKERDIIVALDGQPLKLYAPRAAVVSFLEREVLRAAAGEQLELGILRDKAPMDLTLTLEKGPKLPRQAVRQYFEKIGLSIREFVVSDRISLRLRDTYDLDFVAVVNFVKQSSLADSGGLQNGDVILEIDGAELSSYGQAVELLGKAVDDSARKDFVMLVRRKAETAVLRVPLQ